MPDLRQHSPATERNSTPILALLRRLDLPAHARVLEIASGSGQHAALFAAALPGWRWQPTDADPRALPSIAAWCADLPQVQAPLPLDVASAPWPVPDGAFDAVFCANMLHISPWPSCAALMRGAATALAPGGLLVTYGPYLQDDVPTAESNLAFDRQLRARNPAWGLRRLDDVAAEAVGAGLRLQDTVPMPAHNLTLVWGRGDRLQIYKK